MVRHIVLVGLMGSGKTSVGAVLAARSGRELLDSDELLAARTGATAAAIAERDGIEELHRLEGEVVRHALGHPRPAVITAPASIAEEPGTTELFAGHQVIWTRADPDVLAERVADPGHRPLIDDSADTVLRDQAARRSGIYAALADVVVDTGGLTPEQAATTASRHLSDTGGRGRPMDP